jgi:hypothetical protein
MSYDLIIIRRGGVADGPVIAATDVIDAEVELVETFRKQTDTLSGLKEFSCANDKLFSVARAAASELTEIELHADDPIYPNRPDVVGIPFATKNGDADHGASKPKFESLVGLLPYRKVQVTIDGVKWIIRTRASMTSCSLQTGPRQTKLWWSVEGIPLINGPLEQNRATAFAQLAEKMAESAMDPLRVAYLASLEEISKSASYEFAKKAVQISLSDNDDAPVGELLDALYFRKAELSFIENKELTEFEGARKGLSELRHFVRAVTESRVAVKRETLEVNAEIPNVKGILCRQDHAPTSTTLIAGFARRAGGTGGYMTRAEELNPERLERYVRSVSPARQLSACLAHHEGRQIDQHLGPH